MNSSGGTAIAGKRPYHLLLIDALRYVQDRFAFVQQCPWEQGATGDLDPFTQWNVQPMSSIKHEDRPMKLVFFFIFL